MIEGQVRRFEIDRKVPHMGWNRVREIQPCPLFSGLNSDDYFYFVHSFYCDPEGDGTVAVAGTTDYDIEFCSVLWKDNVMATQFHPEKSQECGLHILSNFAGI